MPNLFLKAKENDSSVKVFLANEDWIDIGKPKEYLSLKNEQQISLDAIIKK